MDSPTTTFFNTIARALEREFLARRCDHMPLCLVADIISWEHPSPQFRVWKCAANPTGAWPNVKAHPLGDVSAKLSWVDVAGSDVDPRPYYDPALQYPETAICSNFAICERYWAEELPGYRAPNLYLPEPGLANIWPTISKTPNVTVDAEFRLEIRTPGSRTYHNVNVHLLSRFSESARVTGFCNLNAHLCDIPPPMSWTLVKQFGDTRLPKSKKKKNQAKRRKNQGLVQSADATGSMVSSSIKK
jgi:hypothetical protein